MPNPEPEDVVIRPPRQTVVPSYLLDYDLTGPGSQKGAQSQVPQNVREDERVQSEAEARSGATSPLSQGPATDPYVVDEEWEQMLKGTQDDRYHPLSQAPDPSTRWQQLSQENATLRHQASQVPELIAALREMKQANTNLRQQVDNLVSEIRNTPKPATTHGPLLPRPPPSSDTRGRESHYQTPVYMPYRGHPADRETYYSPPRPIYKLAEDLSHLRVSHRVSVGSPDLRYSSVPPPASYPRADQYGQRTPPRPAYNLYDPLYGHADRADDSYSLYHPQYADLSSTQEHTYRGPKPSIPPLMSPDPREFSRMKIALENILPSDATERFKFQILTDHLRCEEASLVADSYSNSRQPYTDTMTALTKMYGQPHKLAVQRITELMDGPDVHSGDVKAFRLFALRVRSLVGMLEQLGSRGRMELHCGSHVSRLLSKLPHDLTASFKRFIHPMRVVIPTLTDLAEWLEYELEVQEDSGKGASYRREEPSTRKKENRRDSRPASKPTTILLGTGKAAEPSTPTALSVSAPPVHSLSKKEKGAAYCPYCDNGNHYLNNCTNFKQLNREQKEAWIRNNNRCWRCGRGHQAAKCTLKAPCKTCNRKHLLVLHEVNERAEVETPETTSAGSCLVNTTSRVLYVDRPTYNCKVLLKINKVTIRKGNRSLEAYAVLDDGSERTILLHAAAKKLGLKGKPEDLALRTVRQELQVLHGETVSFTISPVDDPKKQFRIQDAFTAKQLGLAEHTHPTATLQKKYRHLAGLPLPTLNRVHPVLLIGSDCIHLITPIEPVRLGPPGGPAAVRTILGWTLQGPAPDMKLSLDASQCLLTSTLSSLDLISQVEKLWQMDVLPYRSEKLATRSRQDHEAIHLLQEQTIRVNVNSIKRYATPLLRVKNMPQLHAPPEAVLPQLRSIERRLLKDSEQATAYQAEINKLVDAGYVVKVEPDQVETTEESWYIPHHIVQHNGKNRVVYNCSFQYQGHNLNELLLPGPPLGPSLLAVLLRFREHALAFSSDIRGMFHQVRLLQSDKPLLRFLWRDLRPENPPSVYEWQVLPFGTTCSPCCATFALQKHVQDHSQPGEDVQVIIEKSFYVDNCLHSLTSREAARVLVDKLRHLLAEGGFELRQWASNDPTIIAHLPSEVRSDTCELWLSYGRPDVQEPALGLHWHCQSDTLSYKHRMVDCSVATMRNIYKVLASQYDPLGYIIPYTTRAKVLVQRLWAKKRDWDDPQLPDDLLHSWRSWEAELEHLPKVTLPRCYSSENMDHPSSARDIHVFSDASEQAYGAVAYLRTETPQGKVEVSFLAARSRVAPKKQQSIPRLELCAALTGAQLSKVITTELTLPIRSLTLWSDSSTVLTWLSSDSCRYKVFVGTRVAEIQELTGPATWQYVPSGDNPADDITRGLTLMDLADGGRWTHGPTFLRQQPEDWPEPSCSPPDEPESEMRQTAMAVLLTTTMPDPQQHQTLSDYLEATAHQLHGAADLSTPVTADDYAAAELEALKQAQRDSFPEESSLLAASKPVANPAASCHWLQSSMRQQDSSEWEAVSAAAATSQQT
ncbi:hypothetical protein D5F01_LYC25284 [Larimichthys crocea]|uniref:ribonuclease H n=1 Tax=Larimichthys crocea TaxID=215358 RepID=A0A6G0HCQ7_LARCR|nr:hypothetical protein D5F01_LYC25284 [Larimichthys crocea]